MIELKNITIQRGGRKILNDVNLRINESERVAVLGGSGEGKTTLLKLILGLLKPDCGSIKIDGVDITRMNEKQLRNMRTRFGMVFQEGALFDSLSVAENVGFYLDETGEPRGDELHDRINQLLDMVGMKDAAKRLPENLSGGMQRRTAIARSLSISPPSMFLYDEPTSGLDPQNAETICRLILSLARGGGGFLVVTHEIIHALTIAERFVLVKNGRFVFDGDRRELQSMKHRGVSEFAGRLYAPLVRKFRRPARFVPLTSNFED